MFDPELEMEVDALCSMVTTDGPNEDQLVDLYNWIDSLTFSRPKRNITRDFSDGVLMAELIHFYLPDLVNTRNYYAALSRKNKENNWEHLNNKVLSKLGMKVEKQTMQDVMDNKPGAVEKIIFQLRPLLARRNRNILNYRRSISQGAEPIQPLVKYLSQTSTKDAQKSRSRHSSSERKKTSEIIISPSVLKPTLASENRSRSRTKGVRDDEGESRARVEKLIEERSKSIRSQSRPVTPVKVRKQAIIETKPEETSGAVKAWTAQQPTKLPESDNGLGLRSSAREQQLGAPFEQLASRFEQDWALGSPISQNLGSPTTTTTAVFLTEEYILSGNNSMNLMHHFSPTVEGEEIDPTPVIRRNMFGLV